MDQTYHDQVVVEYPNVVVSASKWQYVRSVSQSVDPDMHIWLSSAGREHFE